MHKMSAQANLFPKNYVIHCVISSLILLLSCTAVVSEQTPYKPPLVSLLAKDPNTSLYTISIKDDESPLVVDLAGSLVWSTCQSTTHDTIPCESGTCESGTCGEVRKRWPRHCQYVDGGSFGDNSKGPGGSQSACTGHPYNPVTSECSTGELTSFAMSANTTNGTHLLYQESFTAVGACAPDRLLRSLPEGATGVAGFSRRPFSLPSQLAAQRRFGDTFSLCLPAFATFGDTPVYLPVPDPRGSIDYVSVISHTPLLSNPRNDGYYVPVKGISVSWHEVTAPVSLPAGALDLDAFSGSGGVVLSTTTPYMLMRREVFDALAAAFHDAITRGKIPMTVVERVPAPTKPFELCYRGGFPRLKRPPSYDVPHITLELGAGATRNWTLYTDNYLVEVGGAMCLAILPMGKEKMAVEGEPAVVIGGKQLENNLLVFDRANGVLGFSGLLNFQLSGCRSANLFTN